MYNLNCLLPLTRMQGNGKTEKAHNVFIMHETCKLRYFCQRVSRTVNVLVFLSPPKPSYLDVIAVIAGPIR